MVLLLKQLAMRVVKLEILLLLAIRLLLKFLRLPLSLTKLEMTMLLLMLSHLCLLRALPRIMIFCKLSWTCTNRSAPLAKLVWQQQQSSS